jgi:two-component system C4-dicarboxylate transport response regulator DctD
MSETGAGTTTPGTLAILIVDDEEEVALEIADGLRSDGFTVEVVTSARAALDRVALAPGRFGVVVTDIRMPGMDGIALAGDILAIADDRRRPEVILVTGHGVPREIAQALPPDRVSVVRKPFRWHELMEPLEAAHARAAARMAQRA